MKLARTPLHAQLVEQLRGLIISGELAPGTKIREKELCERFGVSRTPLREAVKVLASEDVLVLSPNRGATVAEHSLDELEDAFAVLGALEALAGELAVRRISDDEIATIDKLHQQMMRHFQTGRQAAYFRINRKIHDGIFAATGNQVLHDQYRQVSARLLSARYIARMSQERWQQGVDDHEKILAALVKRDGRALGRILKRHLTHKFETVREWLSAQSDRD